MDTKSKYEIKSYYICNQLVYYWKAPDGYTISVVRGPGCYLTTGDMRETLIEHIEDYLDA